jgi:hypothetical protein
VVPCAIADNAANAAIAGIAQNLDIFRAKYDKTFSPFMPVHAHSLVARMIGS